jgi:hypothetical protein
MFKDKVEIDTDREVMDRLAADRERARAMINDADEEEPEEIPPEDPKPN